MTPTENLNALPLADLHAARGARSIPLAGWVVPAHYGDPEAEYNAATGAVAWMDVSYMTLVTAEGKDHIEYLNRRLSQRTLAMEVGDGLRANQLNADGRMEADLQLYRVDEGTSWLIAPPAVTGEYLQFLADKYVFSEDAKFVDASAGWGFVALFGPRRNAAVEALGLTAPAEPRRVAAGNMDGQSVQVFETEFLPGAIVVAVPVAKLHGFVAKLDAAVSKLDGRAMGFLAFDTLRVEAGVAWWGIDLTEKSIPLEADLFSAIHTNKGCYPGQETIAKILNLGHPARKLVGVTFDGEDPPAPGQPLLRDGAESGRLTSATFSPRLGRAIGLAMVRWQVREPGQRLALATGGEATVVALPFGNA